MKYLIKNRNTGEETLCEKVVHDGFYYYVKDLEQSKYIYIPKDGLIMSQVVLRDCEPYRECVRIFSNVGHKSVIATNKKLLDLPQVLDEVGELGENYLKSYFGNNDDTLEHQRVYRGFSNGFKKAKEAYRFTKEDMVEFGKFAFNDAYSTRKITTFDELFDLWQEQRTKTIIVE